MIMQKNKKNINQDTIYDEERAVDLARRIRINALKMTSNGNSSHIGAIFSMADVLAVLYENIMNYDSKNPKMNNRDRFILSKGHAGAGIYAVLAEKGFISKNDLTTHYQNGSKLSGHISHKGIPGIEVSTGSLGHGLPIATGMALAGKINKQKHNIYTIISDGECDEGSNWESILFAAHHKLNNLTVVIDRNYLQSIKLTEETIELEPLAAKWLAFGWEVVEIDGHDFTEIFKALKKNTNSKVPKCIIAKTVKGKGVSFMENNNLWHYRSAQGNEFQQALKELKEK
tara:strand:- start:5356 stop:6213 length:858 start_codon:yes stop_codon:yes gene_type:complete